MRISCRYVIALVVMQMIGVTVLFWNYRNVQITWATAWLYPQLSFLPVTFLCT